MLLIDNDYIEKVETTVKPVFEDRSRETGKVVFIGRWSLCTGSFSTGFDEKQDSRKTTNVVL